MRSQYQQVRQRMCQEGVSRGSGIRQSMHSRARRTGRRMMTFPLMSLRVPVMPLTGARPCAFITRSPRRASARPEF